MLYEFPTRSRVVPFVVGGVGLTYYDSHGVLNFNYRGSYNLSGGVRHLLAPQGGPLRIALVAAVSHHEREYRFLRSLSGMFHHSHHQPCRAVASEYWT